MVLNELRRPRLHIKVGVPCVREVVKGHDQPIRAAIHKRRRVVAHLLVETVRGARRENLAIPIGDAVMVVVAHVVASFILR